VRDLAGVAVVNDEVYVIGGYTYVPSEPPSLFPVKINFSAANEVYTISTDNEASNSSNSQSPSNETSNTTNSSNNSNNSEMSNASSNSTAGRIILLSPLNQTYYTSDVSLLFNVDNVSSLIRYSLDGQQATIIIGNTTITGLKNGLHNITIYVEGASGNVEASETSYFIIAEEPFPVTSIVTVLIVGVVIISGLAIYLKKKK
jgi:hypothetical protein